MSVHWLCLVTTALLIAAAGAVAQGRQVRADFFVSPQGNDAWSGKLPEPNGAGTDGPFATLQRAIYAVRKHKTWKQRHSETGAITVLVRGGRYQITRPLTFYARDTGTEQCPITYAAYPGEEVVISGGRSIGGWERGEGKLWLAHIPEVTDGKWHFRQLFVNGQRRQRARIPTEGYLRIAAPAADGDINNPENWRAFRFSPGDISGSWINVADTEVVVMHSWSESRLPINAVDEAKHIVRLAGRCVFWTFLWEQHPRYFIDNVYEGLDSPGEWYLDRRTGTLYYWPLPEEEVTQLEIVAPVTSQMVRIQGDVEAGKFVKYLALRGFSFVYSSWTLPPDGYGNRQAAHDVRAAVYMEGAHHCRLEGNQIAHQGTWGIELGAGCQSNKIVGNRIHDLGGGGVKVSSPIGENEPAEETGHNVVSDNYIYDGGHVYLGAVAIWIGQSSYNTIAHNEIRDFNYSGVSVGWNWDYTPSTAHHNIVAYNHIHHIGRGVLSDMGGVYTLGVSPGTTIHHNLIHDCYSYPQVSGAWGLYTDEASSEIVLENNVVYNTQSAGFMQHHGRDNVLRGNIFAYSRGPQILRASEQEHLSFRFVRNIVYCDNGHILGWNWTNGNYELDYNVYWDTSTPQPDFAGRTFTEWQAEGQDVHSVLVDPKFVDPENGDFRLRADSPAPKLGFTSWDLSEVGPRDD